MLEDGRDVGRQELLVLAKSDDQGTVAARTDDLVGMLATGDGDGVRTRDAQECEPHCLREVMLRLAEVGVFDQVREHLGIRLRLKRVTLRDQLLAQFSIVLDDAVVHDSQDPGAVGMWVGVGVAGATVRGPTCVSDAERTRMWMRIILDSGCQVGDLAGATVEFKVAGGCEDGDPGGVVAAIFEFTKSFKQYGSNVGALWADVADDTAHVGRVPFLF